MTRSLLRELYRGSAPWGPHAVGLAYVDRGKTRVFKRAIHPDLFLRNCNHRLNRAAEFNVGFGHVRYASYGMPHGNSCAHPFVHEQIVFAHNGTLSPNWKTISRPFVPHAEVDSQALGPFIAMRKPSLLPGTKGLIWLDRGILHAYRLQQRLAAFTIVWRNGYQSTVVVTHPSVLLDSATIQHGYADVVEKHELTAGHAYRVLPGGLIEAWVDVDVQDTQMPDLVGPTREYAGG